MFPHQSLVYKLYLHTWATQLKCLDWLMERCMDDGEYVKTMATGGGHLSHISEINAGVIG